MEVEPLAHIPKTRIIDFVWRAMIYHFRVAGVLITNNGWQFIETIFEKFYKDQGMLNHLTLVAHPQANREVEVTN